MYGPQFELNTEWLEACGMDTEQRVFPILRMYWRGGWRFVDLQLPSHVWTVNTAWRGRFI